MTNNLHIGVPEMKSVLFAITMLAAYAVAIYATQTRAGPIIGPGPGPSHGVRALAAEPDVPAWAKAYHTCGTFGATDDDCDLPAASILTPTIKQLLDWKPSGYPTTVRSYPINRGDLFSFCDAEATDPCDTLHLMVKDVCADTIRELTDGSARFSCALVNAATRDAYLRTLEPDKLANTFRAWGEGR